jgi:hypothetical protein
MSFDEDREAQAERDPPTAWEPAVFINWIDVEADQWDGVWQTGPEHRGLIGSKREVEQWAASQGAVRYWIYDGSEFARWDPGSVSSTG